MNSKNREKFLFVSFVLILLAIILMSIEGSLEMAFTPAADVREIKKISYFDFKLLFGYIIVFPPITAIGSILWMVASAALRVNDKSIAVIVIGALCTLFSVISIFFYGLGTAISIVISTLLLIAFVLQIFLQRVKREK